ncbi:MAG: hypothetical protein ACQBVK_01935 [Candidatus Phytoplasma sp. TWB_XP]
MLIVNAAYKYHLETEERRLLLQTDIRKETMALNDKIRMENKHLKKIIHMNYKMYLKENV